MADDIKTLKSYIRGKWHTARSDFVTLLDPSTEENIARVSSTGVDLAAALDFALDVGGPALRRMTFAERGAMLKEMSKALRGYRDELLDLSRLNTGTTTPDAAFDVDGGGGTLAFYAGLAKGLGAGRFLAEGESIPLSRSEGFSGQHVLVPRSGVAVHVNAFNFPVWGFAEKAACALLAGMPVITKPATATAMVTERCIEILAAAEILPAGALQLVCGSTGNLLQLLGPQDVVAFTGSSDTACRLHRANVSASNTRLNIEADSLNAAILGPGVSLDGPTPDLFLRDVVREITQKTGQKCTATRRVLVPARLIDSIQEALIERLDRVVTGNPFDDTVTMGPLATRQQLDDTVQGVARLSTEARPVYGTGDRVHGVDSPGGRGFFFAPVLLRAADATGAALVHSREVFGPVATLIPYDGGARSAAEIVARAGGTLVTSVYGDDPEWLGDFAEHVAPTTGRLYVGSESAAEAAPGSGLVLPQTVHGGPGHAGGGEELGGPRGLRLYQQRVALQGSRGMIEEILGTG